MQVKQRHCHSISTLRLSVKYDAMPYTRSPFEGLAPLLKAYTLPFSSTFFPPPCLYQLQPKILQKTPQRYASSCLCLERISFLAQGAVTSPVDAKMKDADVDRKLRLYGVIQAFRNGNMPDNAQIDSALVYAREHSPVDTAKLSPAGKKLVDDVRDVIETARLIVKEKNADELLQGFVWDTRNTAWDSHNIGKDDVPLTKEHTTSNGQKCMSHFTQ